MTNRQLTSIFIRCAGLLLFVKLFDYSGSYLLSFYSQFYEEVAKNIGMATQVNIGLLVFNMLSSLLLLTKADTIAKLLIKNDHPIQIDLTARSLLQVIIGTTGIIWMAGSIVKFPEFIKAIFALLHQLAYAELNEPGPNFDFIPFGIKFILAYLFIFRVRQVSQYIANKMALND